MGDFHVTNIGPNPASLEVAQTDALEATIFIWHTGDGIKGQLGHPGHASVLLRRPKSTGPWQMNIVGDQIRWSPYDDPDERYVSFWPAGPAKKTGTVGNYTTKRPAEFLEHHLFDYVNELSERGRTLLEGGAGARAGQIVIGTKDDGSDYWGQQPQAIITLPGLARFRRRGLGVHLPRMVDWCIAFRNGPEFNYVYISTSQNCSGIAVRALCAGGADAFARLGGSTRKGTIYFTPNDAEVWAEAVENGIQLANNMLVALRNMPVLPHYRAGTDLPTVQEWKDASKVDWSVRGSLTRTIDSMLEQYHAATWDAGVPKKMDALVRILQAAHTHLQHQNQRTEAYRRLAGRLLCAVELAGASGEAPWSPNVFAG